MVDEQTLLDLWRTPESELVEWKPSLSQTQSIYKAVCAFANDVSNTQQSGVIFVGREDNGDCSNLVITDQLSRDFIDQIRSGSIQPLPVISHKSIVLDGCSVVALIIKPSISVPVQYEGTVYVRQGPSNRKATATEITSLTEKRTNTSFDGQGVNGAEMDDLDEPYLKGEYLPNAISREVLLENGRTLKEQLASLRILTPQFQPTNLGLLVAGKDARRFLPGAYIQFLRVDGLEFGDPERDSAEISGQLTLMLNRALEKIRANIQVTKIMDDFGRMVDYSNYPYEALRELIVNAILHRDYRYSNTPTRITWFDDRIEISNPGGPYGGVTEQNFGQPHVNDYRNPELAAALKYLGYAEKFGVGIARVRRLLKANGNPEIQFEPRYADNYVLAIVRQS